MKNEQISNGKVNLKIFDCLGTSSAKQKDNICKQLTGFIDANLKHKLL